METNSARNSQPETHQGDDSGNRPGAASFCLTRRIERSPDAWKTQLAISGRRRRANCCLKLFRRVVSQRRMEPLRVVIHIYETRDIVTEIFHPAILIRADFFALQRLHEALAFRVVPRISEAAHTGSDLLLIQERAVLGGCILYATIRMMYEPRRGRTTGDRVLQSSNGELRGQANDRVPSQSLRE